jgi:hypothetical protein
MKRQLLGGILLVLCLVALSGGSAQAAVGDPMAVITVPVLSPTGIGVSIADDCEGNLYYTNWLSPYLHKMTAAGALISTTPLLDVTGAPVTIGEMSWDDKRKVLWAGTDNVQPIRIYQIDPVTGICTFQFNGQAGIDLTDGLAYEEASDGNPANDLVYHSPDVSTDVTVFQAISGAVVRVITPQTDAAGSTGSISGLCVGTGNTLYVGHNGLGEIIKVNKFTGAFISKFSSPGGRDEGLECDALNFAPRLALWSKDAYNDQVTAIEVEPGTCKCGGIIPTKPSSWGQVKALYR